MNPIAEAQFHPHSYGFRNNRSAKDAIARFNYMAKTENMHFAVDIDISGFFDNVNHAKLLKQLWTMGFRDKNLLMVLKKMLNAEIVGEGVPDKGTPQGGILSPLLANIVLNELDWWISSQWETMITNDYQYSNKGKQDRALKRTKLKRFYLIRYADDFKIVCPDFETANKIFIATKKWLKERLYLEISEEKSQITNMRKRYSEFLGIKVKVKIKGRNAKGENTFVTTSRIQKKARENIRKKLKEGISEILRQPTRINVQHKYNAIILGVHQYYKMASNVSLDFKELEYSLSRYLYNRLRDIAIIEKPKQGIDKTYDNIYGKNKSKTFRINNVYLFPISGVSYTPPMNYTQDICDYTVMGRAKIHTRLGLSHNIIKYLMENPVKNETNEFNDNRISLFCGQMGKCAITGTLLKVGSMEVHHKIPRNLGGTDEYKNLLFVTNEVHKLIHASNQSTISKYLNIINPTSKQLGKINDLREIVGNYKLGGI